jgi:hypothetical protein
MTCDDAIFDRDRPPRTGLVISTFGAAPYIHLQLEAWRRLCRDLPVLVIDDCSNEQERLKELCDCYGAEFISNKERAGHFSGDMKAIITGFVWAQKSGIELLVKFSRRWIPLVSWQDNLIAIARESQFATYSGSCPVWGFRFRTEAIALHVPSWLHHGGLEFIREYADGANFSIVEWVFHQSAKSVFERRCIANRLYADANPTSAGLEFCGYWPLLGMGRHSPQAGVLWHLWAKPHEYLRALQQWGIFDYSIEELEGVVTTESEIAAKRQDE